MLEFNLNVFMFDFQITHFSDFGEKGKKGWKDAMVR